MSKYILCFTTVSKLHDAKKIGKTLVQKRLAACVNVLPGLTSFYHWKNSLCKDREFLIFIKTTLSQVGRVEKALKNLHPYDLPEFVVLPIRSGSKKYLQWLEKEVGKRHT